jgi:hypothetical protein
MPPRARLAVAFITACTAATAAYALLRLGQFLVVTEANPAQILYSEHAAYFWRSWTAAYVGALLGFATWLAPARVLPHLDRAIIIAAALLVLQSVLVP